MNEENPSRPEGRNSFRSLSHEVADLGDVRLHYVCGGSGDTTVLLHGWPQTWYAWRRVIPLLVDSGHHVIAIDMRGSGDSSRPLTGYDSDMVALDLFRLLETLGIGSVRLVAHDNGGRVAYAFAARYRHMVQSLVFLESRILGVDPEGDPTKALWHFEFHQQADLPEILLTGREREYLSYYYRKLTFDPRSISDADVDEYVRCYSSLGGMRAGLAYYRAFPETAVQTRVLAQQKLEIPVLAYGGSHSMGELPLRSMRHVAKHVTGGVVPNCGHFIPEERPDWLAEEIIRFHSLGRSSMPPADSAR